MRLLKQALAVLGTVVVLAVIVSLVAPKTAHAVIATAVQVVNTPNVNVVNTAAQPVPTVATDALNSFVAQGQCLFINDQFGGAGSCPFSDVYIVPQGKIAVIETVNASCSLNSGTSLWGLDVQAHDPTGQTIYELQVPPSPPVSSNGTFLVSDTDVRLKLYASAGKISLDVFATGPETGVGCTYVLAGHLVSAQ